MRDPNRIYKFCNDLAEIWAEQVPDWRFGQLVSNVFGQMASEGHDPFFPEETEMINYFKKYFNMEDNDDVCKHTKCRRTENTDGA